MRKKVAIKSSKVHMGSRLIYLLLLSVSLLSCKESFQQNADTVYLGEIEQWHTKRIENLKKENGWLNLIGLYWLREGENKFGSAKDNEIIFPPSAPNQIGVFTLKDSVVTIKVLHGVKVWCNDQEVSEMQLQNDLTGTPTILRMDSLRWFVIKRGNKYGIRLRDLNSPLLKEFTDIERFPVNVDWRIRAKFISYDPPKRIVVPNILGGEDEESVSGKIVFRVKEKEYSLAPIDGGEKLFIIFADETNGETTYGAGRFLYADKPDSTSKIIIDFNKAYNPPCVFTKYATCPLPPEQNRLAIKITAGEKNYGKRH